MKVWNDEWRVVGQRPPGETVTYGPWLIINGRGQTVGTVGDGCSEPDIGKLVAAAPAMARLLLAMHAEHGDRHTFDWAYWFSEIEEVLTKAGIPFPE